ncbi:MAG TPA: hypothetical protein VMU04_11805 [Candidatus Acidoferrum sp.]|nr:hypothetical protein [Candidatus Acidoferrum sp.]
MKRLKIILLVVLGAVLLCGLAVGWWHHRDEYTRMHGVALRVVRRLVEYKHEHHIYPASLDVATNGLDMADVRKLQYEPTEKGFERSFHWGKVNTWVFSQVSPII